MRHYPGLALLAVGPLLMGLNLAIATAGTITPETLARTTTLHSTVSHTQFITRHVRGKVLHRYDHTLVVYVPRTVFHTHSRRIVVPAHVVRIKRVQSNGPTFGTTSLIIGVTPPPVTVMVPVTLTIPGPTTTVTGPTSTVTDVTTVTDTQLVTVTVTLPADPGGGSSGP